MAANFGILRARGLWLAAWLACTIASITVFTKPDESINGDEVYWLGQTYYYHLAFKTGEWRHPDWTLIPARENPPGAKYVLGAGIAMQGFDIASLDLLGSFYAYYEANLGRHAGFPARIAAQDSVMDRMMPELRRLVSESGQMYVGPELLRAGRNVALLCGALTSLFVFLLGASIVGRGTGLLASQLLVLHPGVMAAYRLAMSDAPALMLGAAAALATWYLVRRFQSREAQPAKAGPELGSAALVGVLLGLAVAAKLNWVTVCFLFGGVWAYLAAVAWRSGERRRAVRALAIGVVGLVTSVVVFIVINPAIVVDPVNQLMTPMRELALAANIQRAVLPNPPFLATVTARADAVASLMLGTPLVFALAIAGVATAGIKAPRGGLGFVALWWVIAFVAVTAWIPFEWDRYVLPLTIPTAILAAHAIVVGVAALRARFGDRSEPATPADARGDPNGVTTREVVFFACALAALYATMILLSDGQILLTRPLWVDEVWTLLVSRSGSPWDVIVSLSQGADGGAGLVHIGAWALQKLIGMPSPVLLRTISLLCVFAALCLLYVVLRRRFSSDASIAGVLATGSNYLVVTHAFEARFYGPWLLSCAVLAYGLSRRHDAQDRRSDWLVGITAFLMCTVHFYGFITCVLMCAGAMATHGKRWREGLRLVKPAAIGAGVALLLILPLAIKLRGAVSVATWVPEFEPRQLRALAHQFWIARVPLIAGVVLGIAILIRPRLASIRPVSEVARDAFREPGVAALTALALVPVVSTFLTLLGQPSMLFRYNITTALAWAPFMALAMDVAGRWPARIMRVVLVVFWFASFVSVRFEKIVFAGDVQETEDAIRLARAQNAPIVFLSVHSWYPVWQRDHSLNDSIRFLEMSDSTFRRMFRPGTTNEMYNRGLVLDRDVVRVHARRFGVPRLVPETVLDTTDRFVLVAAWAHLPVGFRSIERFARTVFPDHKVTQLDLNSALFERR